MHHHDVGEPGSHDRLPVARRHGGGNGGLAWHNFKSLRVPKS